VRRGIDVELNLNFLLYSADSLPRSLEPRPEPECIVDEKTLKIGAFICLFPDPLQADVDHLPSNDVSTSRLIFAAAASFLA
jgi:hypothetical protein